MHVCVCSVVPRHKTSNNVDQGSARGRLPLVSAWECRTGHSESVGSEDDVSARTLHTDCSPERLPRPIVHNVPPTTVFCDSAHPKKPQGNTTTTPEASSPNRSITHAASHSPQRRPPSKFSPGPSACDFRPAHSDETNPALCSAGVLDSQAQCQPHVTRRRALRDYCARASESRRSRQREPACRPRCTPPPRRLVHRLPARAQISG